MINVFSQFYYIKNRRQYSPEVLPAFFYHS